MPLAFGFCRQLQVKLVTPKANNIAIHHFAPASGLGLTIHSDLPISNQEFRLSPGAGHAFKFEDFVELYRFFLYLNCVHVLLQQAVALTENGFLPRSELRLVCNKAFPSRHIINEWWTKALLLQVLAGDR